MMKREIFGYLSKNFSKEPKYIDTLLISAFLEINRIEVRNNNFIKSYIIDHKNEIQRELLERFKDKVEKQKIEFTIETLIEFFEFVISPEDRVINGAVYTPSVIREYIISKSLPYGGYPLIKIADISCGCGGFLYNTAKEIKRLTNNSYYEIFENQIYGLDIQEYSVTRTKLLLTVLALSEGEDISEFSFNIFEGNALDFEWQKYIDDFEGFDVIVGNPPYVCSRNIPEESKVLLKNWEVCRTGHPDLYIPFFQIALENLLPGGCLGYITMNTFFKSVNGRAIRRYFQEKGYRFKIIDFGTHQVFGARSTYTCICIIEKVESDALYFYSSEAIDGLPELEAVFHGITYESLNAERGWNLTVNSELITQIESIGKPLGEKYKSRNGIATLKNNLYIFKPAAQDEEFYYKEENGFLYPIEKNICRDIVNPNMLTNEVNLDNITEQAIFPYIVTEDQIKVFEEEFFKSTYPNAYSYLYSNRHILNKRDKGKGENYDPWFMYGRNQSLERLEHKLFFPHITPKVPNYVINSDDTLLFYNGLAIIGESERELLVLKKLLSTSVFWFYIVNTSKPYGSGYYSLSKNYFKDFGIPDLSEDEKTYIIDESDINRLNDFINGKYNVVLP